jgi:hypothetical protein
MSGQVSLDDSLKALLRGRRAAEARARRDAERSLKVAEREAAYAGLMREIVIQRSGQRPLCFPGLRLVSLTGALAAEDGRPVHLVTLHERAGGGFVVSLRIAPAAGRAQAHHLAFEARDADEARTCLLAVAPEAGVSVDLTCAAACAEPNALDQWASRLRETIAVRRADLAALVDRLFNDLPPRPAASLH